MNLVDSKLLAFFRRAKVLAHLGMYSEALADSAAILRVNPKDKAAKEDAAAWEGKVR